MLSNKYFFSKGGFGFISYSDLLPHRLCLSEGVMEEQSAVPTRLFFTILYFFSRHLIYLLPVCPRLLPNRNCIRLCTYSSGLYKLNLPTV